MRGFDRSVNWPRYEALELESTLFELWACICVDVRD